MRIELDKMLEKLGVNYVLSPYETMPWVHYDEEKGITCSAEVRMGPTGEDVEAEIQLLYDDREDEGTEDDTDKSGDSGKKDGSDDGEGGPKHKTIIRNGREQVLWMRADAQVKDQWGPKQLRIKAHNYVNEFHGWEEKGCDVFRASVESIQMGEIPDFDELIENNMKDDSFYGGGRRGRIGRKSPNIKPGQLLGMKK